MRFVPNRARLTSHLRKCNRLYAAKNEQRHAKQEHLFFNEVEALARDRPATSAPVVVATHAKRKSERKPLDTIPARMRLLRHERVKYV